MIPNLITLSGICTTLIYVAGYLTGHVHIAMIAASWTMLSDFFDGKVARMLKQETTLGAALDPISDRLFLTAVLGNLLFLKGMDVMLNRWAAAIIVSEFGIIFVVIVVRALFDKKIKVSFVGKLRQIGHLALMGTAIADSYYAIGRFMPIPKLNTTLQLMALLSFTAFVFYLGRAFTICQKKPLIK